jgi:hypothetical protein
MHTLPATRLPSQRRRLLLQCALFAKQEIFGYLLNDCIEGYLRSLASSLWGRCGILLLFTCGTFYPVGFW